MGKTLKELLDEDNVHGDIGIFVKNGCCDMQVSRRYLEGCWEEILNAPAVKIGNKAYRIIKEDDNIRQDLTTMVMGVGLFSFSN